MKIYDFVKRKTRKAAVFRKKWVDLAAFSQLNCYRI